MRINVNEVVQLRIRIPSEAGKLNYWAGG